MLSVSSDAELNQWATQKFGRSASHGLTILTHRAYAKFAASNTKPAFPQSEPYRSSVMVPRHMSDESGLSLTLLMADTAAYYAWSNGLDAATLVVSLESVDRDAKDKDTLRLGFAMGPRESLL